jgi:glycosyltransferase involved in cell wall biosynthesis
MTDSRISVTVIVPAYNEEAAVGDTLRELRAALDADGSRDYRILVVNDGSSDRTAELLDGLKDELKLDVIHSPQNRGYGASLKKGIAGSDGALVITFDSDGQHNPQHLPQMAAELEGGYDAVIGARQAGKGAPLWRVPGRWLLARLVNYLCGRRIPDFNCGLRGFRREVLESIVHLCSEKFSFSATSTMALYGRNASVKFIPVEARRRAGRSTVSVGTGLEAFLLALTSIMFFRPLKIFLPIALVIGMGGAAIWGYELIFRRDIGESAVIMLLTALQLFLIGLLADQIAHLRKQKQ